MQRTHSREVDWSVVRADFPILHEQAHGHPLIYFDNAATTQKPCAVVDALRHYYEHDNANVHRALHELSSRATAGYENSRQRVAEYLGATSADESIFTRGTTESINLVAQAWGGNFLREGDVVLLNGCAISQASASMMTTKLKGKNREETMSILRAFQDLVLSQSHDATPNLGDLRLMQGVRKFPQRVKCAMLAWRALEQALEHSGESTISTEASGGGKYQM